MPRAKKAENQKKKDGKSTTKQKPVEKKNAASSKKKVKKASYSVDDLTHAPLKRILYKAGVNRKSASVYVTMRSELATKLSGLLRKMIIFTEYARRKTVKTEDLRKALKTEGVELCAVAPNLKFKKKGTEAKEEDAKEKPEEEKKKRRAKPGALANKMIRQQQRTEKLCFPRTVFERIVRHVMSDFKADVKFSGAVFYLLQLVCEIHLIRLCEKAHLVATSQSRQTVFGRDIDFVKSMQIPNL